MEFGDIIYFLLVAFFLILSFFNDSKKGKERKKEQQMPASDPVFQERRTPSAEQTTESSDFDLEWELPPPMPTNTLESDIHKEFQSSMSLVTNFEKETSLRGAFWGKTDEVMDYEYDDIGQKERISTKTHPLMRDLLNNSGTEELKKGFIYSEILKRKF